MVLYGLVGKSLQHSFSRNYFLDKFRREGLAYHDYRNFEIRDASQVRLIATSYPELCGLNVTIPFKEQVIPWLDATDPGSSGIGAVNTILITRSAGRLMLTGYNTDVVGFAASLREHNIQRHQRAIILGTGGAARAVAFVLKKMGLEFVFVSRNPGNKNEISYDKLGLEIMESHTFIINTTPLGMFPGDEEMPPLPLQFLTPEHFVYDLIYNPLRTRLLKECLSRGAEVKNGLEMLHLQAEASWEIWDSGFTGLP